MFNIDVEFIEQLKDEGYDLWTISLWENWLTVVPELPSAINQLRHAFRGVKLGDGIGLLEANGLDDYASESELARFRQLDERTNWENLKSEQLNKYYTAPFFFDPQGFHFHLPAFLIAELEGNYDYGFIERIIEKQPPSESWIELLTPTQAAALMTILSLVIKHPDYQHASEKFDFAIQRLASIRDEEPPHGP